MFWSGNYIAVRELNCLLKNENVSLTQVLEADDILQECKADNKALIQFLTKPEVLAELITLITEEPPKNVELANQYRHASIACEVLTSHLSTLADRLSLDTVQMNRLCDFINREPPLNPLLASYFSKTVEMLLERSPKQDWYLYHIVCLRVLDFFRSRRDFLPNLLRHVATSAIADTFKYLLRLDDLFNKIVMEWLDEHQFLESLIQIICGSYVPEPIRPASAGAPPAPAAPPGDGNPAPVPSDEQPEKAEAELKEKSEANHKEDNSGTEEKPVENNSPAAVNSTSEAAPSDWAGSGAAGRWRAVAAANAAALLCDLILNGCAGEGCTTRLRTVWVLVSRLQSEEWVRALLGGMFTSPQHARDMALVHGCQVLLALLNTDPILAGQCAAERTSVELAVAPHLPLLHQTLLHHPHDDRDCDTDDADHESGRGGGGGGGSDSKLGAGPGRGRGRVGAARVHVAALLAQLAISEVEDVPTTMITLGTPGTLVDLFFQYPDNNFLHAQVYALIKHALNNRAYRTQYAAHLLIECDLLNRLMDAYEENEIKKAGVPRAGYMGHVILSLRRVCRALSEQEGALLLQLRLPDTTRARWEHFTGNQLHHVAQQHDTPLGGYYPSENIYEVENMTDLAESMEATYEFNDMSGDDIGDDMNMDAGPQFGDPTEGGDSEHRSDDAVSSAKNTFLELAGQRFDDDMWDDSPEEEGAEGEGAGEGEGGGALPSQQQHLQDVLAAVAPWETSSAESASSVADDADWAQFSAAPAPPPIDPFAPVQGSAPAPAPPQDFAPFWPSTNDTSDIPDDIMRLSQFSISDTFPEHVTLAPPAPPTPPTATHQHDNQPTPTPTDNSKRADVDNRHSDAIVNNEVNKIDNQTRSEGAADKLDVDNDNTIKVSNESSGKCEIEGAETPAPPAPPAPADS